MHSIAANQLNQSLANLPRFTLTQRRIANPHTFQFYITYGETQAGPWAKVGLNDQEYTVGFVPTNPRRVKRTKATVVPLREVANETTAKEGSTQI